MESRVRVLEQLVDRTHEGFWFIDVSGATLDVNPAMCRILARERDQIIGQSVYDFVDDVNKEVFEREIAARRAGTRTGTYEISLQRPDGVLVPCINNASSVWDDDGARIGSIGLWTDITKLKEVESELRVIRESLADRVEERTAQLRQSENRLREAHRLARLGTWDVDEAGLLNWSEEAFDLFGLEPADFDGTSASFYRLVHPDDRDRVMAETQYAWDNLDRYETVHRIIRPDGDVRTVRESAAVLRDENGQTYRLNGAVQDVTEQVEADTKLRRAQKMEAIGQLSGGIAHDFNNLLAIIMGSAEYLQVIQKYDDELVESILKASERGAGLTHRLLAYARRQPLQPMAVNLPSLVSGMFELLRRTLGADVSLEMRCEPDVWQASADPGQVEDALLNLAINARDAMPTGGNLIIECQSMHLDEAYVRENPEARVGDYAVLAVSDNGVGMSGETLERSTEPFFTTKPEGVGSGLGLSMIYGFAQQSGGHLTIYSEQGKGTTVRLYLPRHGGEEAGPREALDGAVEIGRGETILVIEDDEAVGRFAVRLLESLNYKPTLVDEAVAARALLETAGPFDLILSDVVLPNGVSGPAFIDEIAPLYPNTKVLFMSGYPNVAARKNGFVGSDRILLNKPFRRDQIARALREALDGPPHARSH